MSLNLNVGPSSLQPDYLSATDKFVVLQTISTLLEEQINLSLPVDTGLAYEIEFQQKQLKAKAQYVFTQVIPAYIDIMSRASNYYALWQATYDTESVNLKNAFNSNEAKEAASKAFGILATQAGQINQVISAFSGDLSITKEEVDKITASFESELNKAIDSLGASAQSTSQDIDKLNAAISQNINDIVNGANTVGSSVTELIIGTLTTITKAKPDSAGGQGKEAENAPSADFAVSAIEGAEKGVAETEKARADLNANNAKLVEAYQSLAQINALVAVAKTVQVQNALFSTTLSDALSTANQLANTWGQSPLNPPASGISLAFSDFANAVTAVASQADADALVGAADYAVTPWNLFNTKLTYLRGTLTGEVG